MMVSFGQAATNNKIMNPALIMLKKWHWLNKEEVTESFENIEFIDNYPKLLQDESSIDYIGTSF